MIPGEILTKDEDILLNADRAPIRLTVANTGDRPVQVGSHYHFYETNAALHLIGRRPAVCVLILLPEQLFGLNPVRNATFSLCLMAARETFSASTRKSWGRCDAGFTVQKIYARYVWPHHGRQGAAG